MKNVDKLSKYEKLNLVLCGNNNIENHIFLSWYCVIDIFEVLIVKNISDKKDLKETLIEESEHAAMHVELRKYLGIFKLTSFRRILLNKFKKFTKDKLFYLIATGELFVPFCMIENNLNFSENEFECFNPIKKNLYWHLIEELNHANKFAVPFILNASKIKFKIEFFKALFFRLIIVSAIYSLISLEMPKRLPKFFIIYIYFLLIAFRMILVGFTKDKEYFVNVVIEANIKSEKFKKFARRVPLSS